MVLDADITGQPLEAPYSNIDNDTLGLFNTFDDVFIERNEEDDHLALPLCDARFYLFFIFNTIIYSITY